MRVAGHNCYISHQSDIFPGVTPQGETGLADRPLPGYSAKMRNLEHLNLGELIAMTLF
jgi:hypothetical protein